MRVSVLIPVLNEERNIVDCLASVAWADEIVVVDSGSRDHTTRLAAEAGARVVQFHWNGCFPKKKNWAIENVTWRNNWLLILDADERITPGLAAEIQSELNEPKAEGYFLSRRFMFMGRWIKHCGYYPSWNLRLFRHRLGRYELLHDGDTASGDNEVHEHVVLEGRTAYLRGDILHYAYPDVATWFEKHNRYSNWEARVEFARANGEGGVPAIGNRLKARRRLREISRSLPMRPLLRFLYSYILRLGVLDGRAGLDFCRLLATYERMIVLKKRELLTEAAGRLKPDSTS